MLDIFIPEDELFDSEKRIFKKTKSITLHMEHSLVSLYKWEAKFHKPFLESEKDPFEMLMYFECMVTNKNVDPVYLTVLSEKDIKTIDSYINESMTATTIQNASHTTGKREIWTAELIYYYMIMYGIPFECQKWHLNQLLMLIRVCTIKNSPEEKMTKEEIMKQNKRLNQERLKKFNTTG